MKDWTDSKEDERFFSYRAGWRHGTCSQGKDPRFTPRADRPDMQTEYETGYNDGRIVTKIALDTAMARIGCEPSILRSEESGGERG